MSLLLGPPPLPQAAPAPWLTEAWRLFVARLWLWLSVAFVVLGLALAIVTAVALIGASLDHSSSSGDESPNWDVLLGGDFLIALAYPVAALLLSPPAYRMAVRQARGERIAFTDLLHFDRNYGPMVGFRLLASLALVFSAVGIVGPPVVAALLLPTAAMIADGVGVFEAVRRSAALMGVPLWHGIGLVLLLTLFLVLGLVPCGLGLLIVQPLVWLVSAVVYRDLSRPVVPPPLFDHGAAQDGVWPPPPSIRPQ